MAKIIVTIAMAVPLVLGAARGVSAEGPTADIHPAPDSRQGSAEAAARTKDMCQEHYAMEASRLAYVQTRLGLSEQQQTTWNKWRQAVLEQAARERSLCEEMMPKTAAKPTVLEREAGMEKLLGLRLKGLQATRPALETVYGTLTAEQKTLFDRITPPHHAEHRHGRGHGSDSPKAGSEENRRN